jgi:hypothetical protein
VIAALASPEAFRLLVGNHVTIQAGAASRASLMMV